MTTMRAGSARLRHEAPVVLGAFGDDKNDGLSPQTAIYSLKRAKQLQGGRNDHSWHFGPRAWMRIKKELSDKKKTSE